MVTGAVVYRRRNRYRGAALTLRARLLCSSVAVVAAAVACGKAGTGLKGGKSKLSPPAPVDFGQVYQGAHAKAEAVLQNTGPHPLDLTLALAGDPQLSLAATTVTLNGGATANAEIDLAATTLGPASAQIQISGDDTDTIEVTAIVLADLPCPAPGPCLQSSFDPDRGSCISSATGDGLPCDGGDPCQTSSSCTAGVCKGLRANCDDVDVCTTDYCQPGVGCEHLDESGACGGADPCQIYFCDPTAGCKSSAAADGTPCQSQAPCIHANICLGGSCTGLPVPDGTSCLDPRDPCAPDATCHSGQCHSPTAEALVPGDILWQAISSAFSDGDGGTLWDGGIPDASSLQFGWRAAAASDADGDLYLDDLLPDGGCQLVSLDLCGRPRWRVDYASSTQWTNGRHLLATGMVISVGTDQTLSGQSQTTGQLLWTFDPAQQAGVPPNSGFVIEDIALAQSGILYYSADWTVEDPTLGQLRARLVGGLLRNGQAKFQSQQPSLPYDGLYPNRFGYPLMVDENENLFTAMNLGPGQGEILSFDQTGAQRFALPLSRENLDGLSENHGLFVEPVSVTAFDDLGRVAWSHTEPLALVNSNGHSPVVSSEGHAMLLRYRYDKGLGVAESYDASGTLLWQTMLQADEEARTSDVLDSAGLFYFVTNSQRLLALRESDGSQAWSLSLPSSAPVYNGVLALTPAGALVASVSERLFGIYAGNGLSTGPWPRFRGGNDNASAPATPAQPAP